MNREYYEKYLKYKSKYMALKSQIGNSYQRGGAPCTATLTTTDDKQYMLTKDKAFAKFLDNSNIYKYGDEYIGVHVCEEDKYKGNYIFKKVIPKSKTSFFGRKTGQADITPVPIAIITYECISYGTVDKCNECPKTCTQVAAATVPVATASASASTSTSAHGNTVELSVATADALAKRHSTNNGPGPGLQVVTSATQ